MATSSTTYTTFSSYPQAASSTRSRNPAPSSTASLGPSNVPGSAIKSGTVSPVSTATEMDGGVGLGTGTTVEGGGKGVNGLAIGLGVGVGLLVLLTLVGSRVVPGGNQELT